MSTEGLNERFGLHIDWTQCRAQGVCIELMSDRLVADEWGYPIAIGRPANERTTIPLESDELAAAQDAVSLCPVLALSLRKIG